MRLLRRSEFRSEPGDFLYRERRAGHWIAGIALAIGAVGFFVVSSNIEQASRPASTVSLICVLFMAVHAPGVIRGLRADAWVVCVRQPGIALNLRSYWNSDRSDADPVVAWFEWKELHSAGECRVDLRLPDPDNWRDRRYRERHLEIELTHTETEELRRALSREFAWGDPTRVHYFAPTVLLMTATRLRIAWKDERHALTPRIEDAIQRLVPYVPIRDLERSTIDWRKLGPAELERLQHDLFRSGHHDQVVRLLRKQRRWKRKRAEQFVADLAASTRDAQEPAGARTR